MDNEGSHQSKQERLRTRWTPYLDKIFADLVVEQIQLGNRPNSIFDKKTWNQIRDMFNKQTDLHFNNNQLRKHLDVLRTRYYNLKSSFDQNNSFPIDDSCCIGFDLLEDIPAQLKPETIRIKDCPIYEQLCTIFSESGGIGKYAQSSHYEEFNKSVKIEIPCLEYGITTTPTPCQDLSVVNPKLSIPERKRKRQSETQSTFERSKEQVRNDAMAEAMLEMLAASKLKADAMKKHNDDRFSICNCIKVLDEMSGVDEGLYFAALDLFDDYNLREIFICLRDDAMRLAWLQGKLSNGTVL